MKRRGFLALAAGLSGCQQKEKEDVWRRGIVFGTDVSIRFRGISSEDAERLGESALSVVLPVEDSVSLWQGNSEIRRLNRDGVLKGPSGILLELLEKSRELWVEAKGAFDPTVHSYLEWLKELNVEGRKPTAEEVRKRLGLVDFGKVKFSQKEISLPEGMSLSLNGIAQGYATDRVAELLSQHVDSALVNFGEFRVVGERSFAVEVEGESLEVRRALAVSSGGGQRLRATESANHLINPQSGGSPPPRRVVAVEASEAWLADGLATVVALGGEVPSKYKGVETRVWE